MSGGSCPPNARAAFRIALPAALLIAGATCADAPSPTASVAPVWTADVELRIGSVDDPETALSGVGSILSADDGRFYVAQPQDGQVRIHAQSGALLRRFGSPGEGPGEFATMGAMGWWGAGRDTLWVHDLRLRRISLFTPEGAFVRTQPIKNPPYQQVMNVGVQAILPDGTGLGVPTYPSALLAQGQIRAIPVLRFAVSGGEPDAVVEMEPGQRALALQFGDGFSYSNQLYGDAALAAISSEAARVAVVERPVATGPSMARFRVTMLGHAGDTLWSRDYPYEPLPIPPAEADTALARRVEASMEFATRMGLTRADVEREVRAKLYLPAFRPPLASALLSSDGALWLERTEAPEARLIRWLGLDPAGEPMAALELPYHTRLRSVMGSTAWAVETDDYGVSYVLRMRLRPAEP